MAKICEGCALWNQDKHVESRGECQLRLPPWLIERIEDLRPRGVDSSRYTTTYWNDDCSFWQRRES